MYYQSVPKTLRENLEFRRYLIAEGKQSEAKALAIREACREDILFWVNAFVWTFDPRRPEVEIPFITYHFQDEAILSIKDHIEKGKQLVLQKVRDMGASWMSVLTMDHQATFEKSRRFVMMSYTADLVEKKGNPKSLLWKLDFIHKWLPAFLRPTVERRLLGREYLDSRSTVDGCTTTERSNVGDRATAVFIDEFSRFDPNDAALVRSGLADVTPCRIWNFTPNPTLGKSHPSYELIEQVKRGDIDGLTMHWRDHPEKSRGLYRVDRKTFEVEILDKDYPFPKDYPFQRDGKFEYHSIWFDKERRDRGNDNDVAMNMELEWDKSSNSVFDVEMVEKYVQTYCKPPQIEGDLLFTDEGEPKEFVITKGGPVKLWMPIDSFGKAPRTNYYAGTDVSFGRGTTNSCFSVGRRDTSELCLEYATPFMEPITFARKCVALCRWLTQTGHECKLCWERQGPGDQFGAEVLRLGYHCIYFNVREIEIGGRQTKTPGWVPLSGANSSKAKLLGEYQASLANGKFIVRSKAAMLETLGWINTPNGPVHRGHANRKNDPSGAEMNHGDRVISTALCDKMRREGSSSLTKEKEVPLGCLEDMMQREQARKLQEGLMYRQWRPRKLIHA